MPTSSQPMTSADLQRFISAHDIEATILHLDDHTPTVPDAARALGVETDQIIKSLVFRLHDEPLLVINNGTARIDRRKLAAALEVGRKRVKFADADQALAFTGFVVGAMPPFGHLRKLRTLVDPAVLTQTVIFGGGGDINAMMRVTPVELMRVANAEQAAVSE